MISKVWPPQSHDNMFFILDRGIELSQHRRSRRSSQLVFSVKIISWHRRVFCLVSQAGGWLNTHDAAAEALTLAFQILNLVDAFDIFRNRQRQLGIVIVSAQIFDVVAMLFHIVVMGHFRPRGWIHIDIAIGYGGVEHGCF